jgi:hypothetical protein
MNKKAQGMVGGIIALVIGIILIVSVAIPVVQNAVSAGNFTGTTATITNLFVVLLAIGGLVLIAGGFLMGKR